MTENGRSFVEMLGTLAIMGIISVTTIVGFKTLMNKHDTNTLIYEGQKRASVISGQIGLGQTPSLVEFDPYNVTSAGEFGKEVVLSDSVLQFGIPVSGVKKAVCQNILVNIGDKTALRRLSPANNFHLAFTDCEDDNSFLMIYNNDLGTNDKLVPPTPCYEDTDCKTECATCQIPDGDFKGICAGECDALCQEGDTCGDNECVVCDPDTKTCKNGCIEVEYLESTGTQYIDTEIHEDATCIIDMQATRTTNTTQVVLANTIEGTRTKWFGTAGTTNYYSVGGSTGVSSVSSTTRKECVITFTDMYSRTSSSVSFYFKDNPSSVYTRSDSLSGASFTLRNIYVGSFASAYPSYFKIYGLKIYNTNNTLLRNFIPVIAPDGEACMYDKVSKKLFRNKGSGDFLIPNNSQ